MTGWRIGYAAGALEIMEYIKKYQDHSTSNPTSVSQVAALEALKSSQESIDQMRQIFRKRRDLMLATGLVSTEIIPLIFFALGFGYGVVAPSRDLLVKLATPKGVSGRVYGIVYSGIDLGAALGPFIFGFFMDAGLPKALFVGIALFQLTLIPTVFKVSPRVAPKAI